ncbi:MAG: DUF2975 domain-containing protein [Rhodospirillaceae bacterium]
MPDSDHRLLRITRISRVIATLCGVLFVIFPLGLAALCFFGETFLAMQNTAQQMGVRAEDISLLAKTAAYGAIMVQTAPLLLALWALRCLFAGYATGAVFTMDAARQLKRVALALISTVIVRPLGVGLFSLALSIDTVKTPGGQGHLIFMFGSTEVLIGLAGGMVLVTAWVMGEAAALAEENRSFV